MSVNWRVHEGGTETAFLERGAHAILLTIHPPDRYSDVWTSQAETLDADYRQLKFSGLLNGGDNSARAREVALIAMGRV